MKSFYSTSNMSLSAYMGEHDGSFETAPVMENSEVEMKAAIGSGYAHKETDAHSA